MGLSGPKRKTKISNDPNNNAWSRNTDRFGHKILTAHGWTPGSYLGAKNASHSDHYTVANASHIRVLLKEDNLGLGARRPGETAENFGLSALQGLLGRLNGKSEGELKKEEKSRQDVQLASFHAQRWGRMHFVSGGFLVGDVMEKKIEKKIKKEKVESQEDVPIKMEQSGWSDASMEGVGAKKRKRSEVDEPAATDEASRTTKTKKRKQKQKHAVHPVNAQTGEESSEQECNASGNTKVPSTRSFHSAETNMSKSKRKKKKAKDSREVSEDDNVDGAEEGLAEDRNTDTDATRKAERKKRKEERRMKREAKRLKRERRAQQSEPKDEDTQDTQDIQDNPSKVQIVVEATEVKVKTPSDSASSATTTVNFASGRHAVRQRYIRQKKMASLDPQALKEIFMIKAPA
ncbi:hypothetical protein NA57DRAFT_75864 [Rhizodiscina lignyota]|uniref:G-patch domain-containing protein n=1 Tax=Rhizodiscina lignyota TaxID=1504668 RepID=A0A9P4II52_9PEZI|nr:hypothetical protein NA57DRAFT_75864 [Rhizodiscina lignyota]